MVFVSGAAGAVGSVACQIAKLKGHTVVGTAGGPEKVKFLKDIGVDHAIDYKAHEGHLARAVLEAAPEGIDVYFDNVGGEHLEAALTAAKPYGRFALCGGISGYNLPDGGPGIRGLMQAIGKSLRLEGYLVSPHFDLMPAYLKNLSGWIAEGKFNLADTVDIGIENAPKPFLKLFDVAATPARCWSSWASLLPHRLTEEAAGSSPPSLGASTWRTHRAAGPTSATPSATTANSRRP